MTENRIHIQDNGLVLVKPKNESMVVLTKKEVCDACKKQMPKKPVENRYPWAICPVCGGSVYLDNVQEHIQKQETTYCEHCGQALDWSDTE